MKVQNLSASTKEVFVEVLGQDGEDAEKVSVTYRPGRISLDLIETMNSALGEGDIDAIKRLTDQMADLIVAWDLTDTVEVDGVETEVPYPPTQENISAIPLEFLGEVIGAFTQDTSGTNPTTNVISPDISSPKERQDGSLTGTRGTPSPNTSDALPGNSESDIPATTTAH